MVTPKPANDNDKINNNDMNSSSKKKKAMLDKSRKKEIKSRLNAEAGREIRPLAVGTLAMMGSALANQGERVFV